MQTPTPRQDSLPHLLDVRAFMVGPVAARPGDVIAVTPHHPHAPLAVMRPVAGAPWHLLRAVDATRIPFLLPLIADGTLTERSSGAHLAVAACAIRSGTPTAPVCEAMEAITRSLRGTP